MAERKVANKYYPPDFDPKKIPRRKQPADRQQEVRLMAPFSMRCNTCGNYIYKGKKFNARKETALGETYFGVKIFRFYIKCPQCSAEITFKTDPKNTDYAAEHGASRNFEPWRDKSKDEEDPEADPLARIIAEEEGSKEEEDPMKSLEARTLDAKREMEILDALQDIRTRNARMERVNADEVLKKLDESAKGKERELSVEEMLKKLAEEEDEMLVRRHFGKDLAAGGEAGAPSKTSVEVAASLSDAVDGGAEEGASTSAAPSGPTIKRAVADEDEEGEPDVTALLSDGMRAQLAAAKAGRIALGSRGAGGAGGPSTNGNGALSNGSSTAAAPSSASGVKRPAGVAGLGSGKTTSSPLGIVAPAAKKQKKKTGVSAFGIVRKKT